MAECVRQIQAFYAIEIDDKRIYGSSRSDFRMHGVLLGEGAGGVPKVSMSYYRIYLEERILRLRRFFEERSGMLLAIIFGSSLIPD